MSWAKIDDQLHAHRKIKRAWKCRAALGLHLMAISYSAAYDLDGFVPEEFVEEKLPNARERAAAVVALTDVPAGYEHGLWETVDGGWLVHDWAEYNGDAEARKAARQAKVEAGRKGAAARWQKDGSSHSTCHANANGTPNGEPLAEDGSRACARPFPSPSPLSSSDDKETRAGARPSSSNDIEKARSRLQGEQVDRVWAAYVEARTGVFGARSEPKLTDTRRRLIASRLRDYPEPDLIDAVRGWRHLPHNRGENEQGTPYCDIELVLRVSQTANNVERFRDVERAKGGGSDDATRRKLTDGTGPSAALQAALEAEGLSA